MSSKPGPLDGVRVVDFTHILAGPFCTQFMADAGATIVKVEPPGGEYARIRGPRRVGPDGTELSSYNAAINRGKSSISLDLKSSSGLELALRLVKSADVVVENFAPGALARLGLNLRELREHNPRLITASISLYGGLESAGQLATRRGLAIVAEGESSVTGMTRDKNGVPLMLGLPIGDMATGMAGYAAITTALFERERTGIGQHVDVSMVRTLFALNACAVTGAQIANANRFDLRTAGYGIFPAADGYVSIGVNNDALFQRLCGAMDRNDLAVDPRYAEYHSRDLYADEIDALIAEWTGGLSADEVISRVASTGVPCGKVTSPGEMLADEELRRLGFVEIVDDGLGGTIDTPSNPLGFRRDTYAIPRLAEHARELLADIGVDEDEFAKLAADGAFGTVAG